MAVEAPTSRPPRVSVERVQALLVRIALGGGKKRRCWASVTGRTSPRRWSPSEDLRARGAEAWRDRNLTIRWSGHWDEMDEDVWSARRQTADVDAIVFAVPHREYRDLDFLRVWLVGAAPLVFDAFNVLTSAPSAPARALGCRVESIGRGEGPVTKALVTGGAGFLGSPVWETISWCRGSNSTCSTTSRAARATPALER